MGKTRAKPLLPPGAPYRFPGRALEVRVTATAIFARARPAHVRRRRVFVRGRPVRRTFQKNCRGNPPLKTAGRFDVFFSRFKNRVRSKTISEEPAAGRECPGPSTIPVSDGPSQRTWSAKGRVKKTQCTRTARTRAITRAIITAVDRPTSWRPPFDRRKPTVAWRRIRGGAADSWPTVSCRSRLASTGTERAPGGIGRVC